MAQSDKLNEESYSHQLIHGYSRGPTKFRPNTPRAGMTSDAQPQAGAPVKRLRLGHARRVQQQLANAPTVCPAPDEMAPAPTHTPLGSCPTPLSTTAAQPVAVSTEVDALSVVGHRTIRQRSKGKYFQTRSSQDLTTQNESLDIGKSDVCSFKIVRYLIFV